MEPLSSYFRVIACIALILGSINTHAQVSVNDFPLDKQLYARNRSTNKGTVRISGQVNRSGTNYSQIRVKVYRNGSLQTTISRNLSYSGNTASFSVDHQITAEKANYRFRLYGYDGSEDLIREANDVVAGDAYIIQGQSNAEARRRSGSASANGNQSSYIRVYGSGNPSGWDKKWFTAQGDGDRTTDGNAGQWGLRLAKRILDTYNVPVAIFNGAHGGQRVSFFQRNDGSQTSTSTNYGRLLKRTQEAGLQSGIRAIFWHQGEEDAEQGTSQSSYESQFTSLYNDWNNNFSNVQEVYILQIRNGCGNSKDAANKIKEAQRKLALNLSKVNIMSTTAIPQIDFCHFGYDNGYKEFAERLFRLVRKDLYGGSSSSNIEVPQIKSAYFSGSRQITIETRNSSDNLDWDSNSEDDFDLEGSSIEVTSGSANGNKVILNLSSTPSGTVKLSYEGHQGSSNYWITNSNGIGFLCFYNFTVSGSAPPPSGNDDPNAEFTATPTSGSAPLNVSFNASSSNDPDGSIVSYSWSFGDGTNGSGQTTNHTYNNAGTYSARLTVTDNDGATDTRTRTITVSGSSSGGGSGEVYVEAECASFGSNYEAKNGSGVSEGEYVGSRTSTSYTSGVPGSSDRFAVNIDIPESGTYYFWARVKADDSGSDSYYVRTNNGSWVTWNGIYPRGDWYWIRIWDTNNGKTPISRSLSQGTLTLEFAKREDGVDIDKILVSTNANANPSGQGGTAEACGSTPPPSGNNAPNAEFSASPTSGSAPLNVSFNASASSDSDGSISSYSWNFGDGSAGSGMTTSHTYNSTGTFTATLTVTDNDGATDARSRTISVGGGTPPPSGDGEIYVEAECGTRGSNMREGSDSGASDGTYVYSTNGSKLLNSPSGSSADNLIISVDNVPAGTYYFWARVRANDGGSDSYWVRINGGSWVKWNEIFPRGGWHWVKIWDSDNNKSTVSRSLSGTATFEFSHREPGIRIDKILLSTNSSANPQGVGGNASSCGSGNPNPDPDPDPDPTPNPSAAVYLEAECFNLGSRFNSSGDNSASNDQYVVSSNTSKYLNSPSGSSADIMSETFSLSESGNYSFFARVRTYDKGSDSYWLRIDGGSWVKWNNFEAVGSFQWERIYDSDNGNANLVLNLSSGTHTIEIAHREPRIRLDKIYIAKTSTTPNGEGGGASNCSQQFKATIPQSVALAGIELYPNPATNHATLRVPAGREGIREITLLNTQGQIVKSWLTDNEEAEELVIDTQHLPAGMYAIYVQTPSGVSTKRLMISK